MRYPRTVKFRGTRKVVVARTTMEKERQAELIIRCNFLFDCPILQKKEFWRLAAQLYECA